MSFYLLNFNDIVFFMILPYILGKTVYLTISFMHIVLIFGPSMVDIFSFSISFEFTLYHSSIMYICCIKKIGCSSL
jgi:hypothetical protein